MIEKTDCEEWRRAIKPVAEALDAKLREGALAKEVGANVQLAYRHLEDASMRLGKAIQAIDGGVSVYDMTQTPKNG